MYAKLQESATSTVEFDADFYDTYRRSLAALEAGGLLKGNHTLNERYAAGVSLTEPTFIMYMCALTEDPRNSCCAQKTARHRAITRSSKAPGSASI